MRIPRKWLQKMMDHLGVNPIVEIYYTDNPATNKHPNNFFAQKTHGKYAGETNYYLDGLATDENRVYIYGGKWRNDRLLCWSPKYLKWVLAHELRHHYFFYHKGNTHDPWKGLSTIERDKREERACNRFASLIVGVPDRDYPIYISNGKIKNKTTRKPKT
jgi:hypothetical protein